MQLLRGALAITVVSATLLLSASAGCALPITGQDVYIITERELYESLPDVNSFQLIFVDDDQDVSNHPQKKVSSGNFQMADPYADRTPRIFTHPFYMRKSSSEYVHPISLIMHLNMHTSAFFLHSIANSCILLH
ncbi:hypothetical protein BOH78_1942 [Pichia kudriavzevii]|uniref:Uncharacterized protein n=1 Tax=Pichia kudriavzevii TaxID=4909 RepID=A0A1V2LQB7_PICKU|nr:hypothetical protein BOH78_1942 [Pichia kudriavzevii]